MIDWIVKKEKGVLVLGGDHMLWIEPIREMVIRCVASKNDCIVNEIFLVEAQENRPQYQVEELEEKMIVSTKFLSVEVEKTTLQVTYKKKNTDEVYLRNTKNKLVEQDVITFSTGDEEPEIKRVKTVDGERNFIQNLKPKVDRKGYQGTVYFQWDSQEELHGFGQAEEGIYNYRGTKQYLYQHNMRIPVPMFVSTKKYGVFFDCSSLMTFQDQEESSIFLDTIDQIDYYFMAGENLDDVMRCYRQLTGKAVMLPKWAYGYVQSKEAYRTSQELVDVVAEHRKRKIPLDVIVQDWNTWEPGDWGQKTVDKTRFSGLREAMDKIHDMNVHTMVSVWPNMNPGGENHKEFFENKLLLNDYSTYDAFNEEGRNMYWKQAEEELFSGGFDSWWCDSTEPFSGPDWGGEEKKKPEERYQIVGDEHKKYLDPAKANAFALMHAKGIFENQRKADEKKRVLNLTRSGYAGSQKYGTVLWSGDISASWKTLREQIVEGLNFCMSGMPYWTLDIGAFFVVGSAWEKRGCGCSDNPNPLWFWKGEYNGGVADDAYKELYVRWLEYGVFLPMFRSHGTDTPREIWNFGEKGEPFYDAIEENIKLRYRLLPYIYSIAGQVWKEDQTMMRSLLFDFLEDKNTYAIWDQYMFGPSLMICPITQEKVTERPCYLPKDSQWYNYHTAEKLDGGQWVVAQAPLNKIPIFVKAGAIIPSTEGLQYATQEREYPLEIKIYPGADGCFEYYEDGGDGYEYEQGAYATTLFIYHEANKEVTIGTRQGSFPGMKGKITLEINYMGKKHTVIYNGEEMKIKLS